MRIVNTTASMYVKRLRVCVYVLQGKHRRYCFRTNANLTDSRTAREIESLHKLQFQEHYSRDTVINPDSNGTYFAIYKGGCIQYLACNQY